MWWNGYGAMPWMFFGPVMMLVFLVMCFAIMYFMMRGGMKHWRGGSHAVEILKERFARGEIDKAEFEERRRLLLG